MESQHLKKFCIMAIAIFCFVSIVGLISASNSDLNIDDARDIAINNLHVFFGSVDCISVGEGTYYNDNYIFPVEDINTSKTIGNIYVNSKNGTCTTDFLTKDDARNIIYKWLKDNKPNGLYVPQTPKYISNVHYGVYGFEVLVVNFNEIDENGFHKTFKLYVDKNGIITD